ncbi:GNAT family N-acetyltransferase [Vibrio cholerae]|nr:GNAT family N-acetyltransferase [Vibrio cholerae]
MPDKKIKFVEYNEHFLIKSWEWLNDPEIKKLTLTPDFTKEQQKTFFKNIPQRTNFKIWGVKYGDESIGVVGLKNITSYDAEYFGYIGEKNYWSMGIFKFFFYHVINECKILQLSKLYLHVDPFNERAVKAYLKSGFYEVNKLNDVLRMEVDINYDR